MLFAAYELKEQGIISDETWGIRANQYARFLENSSLGELYRQTSRLCYPEQFFIEIESYIGDDDI